MTELTALDRLQIIELQSIYAWGIDGRDGACFALAFSDDVEAQYTNLGTMRGLDFFTRWMNAFHAPFDATQHLISNCWLTVEGDEVVMRSYVIAHIVKRGCPGGDICNGGGYYTDRVARTEAGWRIRSRDVVNFWRDGNPRVMDFGREAVGAIA